MSRRAFLIRSAYSIALAAALSFLTLSCGPTRDAHDGIAFGAEVTWDSLGLMFDGKRVVPAMGEIHFSRVPSEEWSREIRKMKEGGLSFVASYVFWNHFEEVEGKFDWSGQRNLRHFLEICRDENMPVVLRIGPFCHGEARNGGFPDWIFSKDCEVRSEDPAFLEYVRRFYKEIYSQAEGLQWKDGGPLLSLQFDNEWGGDGSYLTSLKKIALEVGFDLPFYTRTGWPKPNTPIAFGEMLPLYGGYAEGFWNRGMSPVTDEYYQEFNFRDLRLKDMPDDSAYPFFTCELGGGMMPSYNRRVYIHPEDVYSMAVVKLAEGSNLLGYYMYHGGTNPEGKLTTMNEDQTTLYVPYNELPVKTYDFQAPIGEFGQLNPQYYLLRKLHIFMRDYAEIVAPMSPYYPNPQDIPPGDDSFLRWNYRANGNSGFVFINNHERHFSLSDKKGVNIEVRGVKFPTMDVPSGTICVFPFNVDGIEYATAQIVAKRDGNIYLQKIEGIPVEIKIGRKVLKNLEPLGPEKPVWRNIYLLTEEQAGRLFMEASSESSEKEELPLEWEKIADTASARNIVIGPYAIPHQPVDSDFEKAAVYRIKVPRSHEGLLDIDYYGDAARLYAEGKLLDDNFFNSKHFQFGLWRLPAGCDEVELRILPVQKDMPVLFPKEAGDMEPGEHLSSVRVLLPASIFKDSEWISTAMDDSVPNQWVCFRKTFDCGEVDPSAVLNIGVDSKYWLWVNGQLVVFEGGLRRGPNPDDTYYDSVSIGKNLRKGENTVAVLVWYFGKEGFNHKNSGKCGLIAALENGGQTIAVSDQSWKAVIHPAFGDTDWPHPNFRLPESNVLYDARRGLGEWMSPGYDDSSWEAALGLGNYPCSPWNILWRRPIPNWKDSGIIGYERVENETDGDVIRYKGILPKNISVTPYMKIRSEAGLTIDLRSDNYDAGGVPNVRAEYITRDGEQEFEMPNYVNGHSIIYTCPKDVEVIELGYRETAYNTEHIGRFSCSDDFYNTLWQKSLTTMNLNMRDAIQDPDRERSQWWGDATIVLGEILYSCDSQALPLIKKAIDNLVDWQKPDGVLYSPVPAGNWDSELPLQSLASIGKFGFWDYYFFTGDKATMLHAYPAIRKYLSLWNLDENDLVIHRRGGWDWPDWGENTDVPVMENAWYCLALETAREIAKIARDNEYASWCESLRSRIISAARKCFWDGQCYRSPGHAGPPDDRANGLALLAGFALPGQEEGIKAVFQNSYYASPYMEKYILESLFMRNDIDAGLARMRERYKPMVDSHISTLWEAWDVDEGKTGSINHGWAAGPLTLLSQYIAGISPVGPGWEKVLVHPQLGDLEWVECAVPVRDDLVELKAARTAGGLRVEVHNSTGKPCQVVIPDNACEIRYNGKELPASSLITVQGSLNGTNDGRKAVESADGKMIVEYVYEK